LADALPTEILTEIFLYFPAPRLARSSRPQYLNWMRLRLVSRRWNAVLCATPQLWSHLDLRLDPKYPSPPTSVIELWLSCSAPLPLDLDLFIEFRDQALKKSDTQISEIMDVLWDDPSRLRRIDFSSESGGKFSLANRPMYSFRSLKFISLSFLDIKPCYHPFHEEMDMTMRVLSTAPALRGIRIDPFMPATSRAMLRDLSQLRRLTRLDMSMCQAQLNAACHVLRECHSLKSIYFKFCCHRDENIPDPAPVYLPNLRVFAVTSESPTPDVLLSIFKAPNLELIALESPITPSGAKVLSAYIDTTLARPLRVLCVSELEDAQLAPFFHRTQRLAKIPIVGVRAFSAQSQMREVEKVVGAWPDFNREVVTSVTYGERRSVGWKDPVVRAQFEEYFVHPWRTKSCREY
jgi:hypothetical protein